ncbi:MAG: arginine--tRNA ligase [Candidatus Diapherotrites archaeon]
MKEVIVSLIQDALKKLSVNLPGKEIEKFIEIPPSSEMGDYAFPCFFLAKILKEEPPQIVVELRGKMKNPPFGLEDIQTRGPYLNFFLDRKILALNLIKKVNLEKENFGKSRKTGKKTMVEFPSPNTNKPLHLGHLRNMVIGESISRILDFGGDRVIRANLNNDRGISICQSMAAYKIYGKGKTPRTAGKKSDHFVGEFYVKFNEKQKHNKKLEIESHRMLQKWEEGDKETIALWKKMNKWALDGFEKTYKKFGIKHNVEFFESKIYKKGREIILDGLKRGIFKKKKDRAIAVDLKKEKLGEKILLRMDGTSVYITQDLYLAKLKQDKYKLDNSIYVVANEQNYHFNVLFTILKKLGLKCGELKHLSYGMVNLPEGRMKSREGTVVDADDLIEKVQLLVKKELEQRYKLSKTQIEERSLKIALAAIKYLLLKVDIRKNMIFNPKESVNFEGDTGSYILYSYARASSILQKFNGELKKSPLTSLEDKEIALVKKLSDFTKIIQKAYFELNPSLLSNYAYQLSQIFNEFYHACPVIGSEKETFRIELVKTFRQVLKNSLYLLGIETLEKM